MARHFILLPFGSAGDVNPFMCIARCLRDQRPEDEVTLLVSPPFEEAARKLGVGCRVIGEPGLYERVVTNPDLWHPLRGSKLVMSYAGQAIDLYYAAIREVAVSSGSKPVLMSGSLAFGARLAREKLGYPLVSVHLQPSVFMSVHEMPVPFAGWEWITRLPVWAKRLVLALPNPIDRLVRPYLAPVCRREGVPLPRHVWPDWFHSPDLVLGLFPDWFASPQPDWPANVQLTGFPGYDRADHEAVPPGLEHFLAAGNPPVLVTPGSANAHGRAIFAATIEACRALGQRLVVVTPYRDQLPEILPDWAHHIERVPFSLIAPRCAAFIHHGGIGTMAQGFAAGVPQLVIPMAHDQPDNANRLVRLGAGRMIYPKKLTAVRLRAELDSLLSDPAVAEACSSLRARFRENNAEERLLAGLDRLL